MYSKDGSATTTLWTVKADWSVCVTAPSFHTVTQQLLSGNSSGIERLVLSESSHINSVLCGGVNLNICGRNYKPPEEFFIFEKTLLRVGKQLRSAVKFEYQMCLLI